MNKIPEPDISTNDLWVVANWSGNPYSNELGSWSISAGPYFKEDTAILVAQKMNESSLSKDYKSMSLEDFHYECRNV